MNTQTKGREFVDVSGLSEAEIDDIRSHVAGKRDAKDTYEYEWGSGWRCFHCGEMFKTPGGAELHFGKRVTDRPLCIAEQKDLAKAREDRDHEAKVLTKLNTELGEQNTALLARVGELEAVLKIARDYTAVMVNSFAPEVTDPVVVKARNHLAEIDAALKPKKD
jgi:hypothetical protein